jgi:hypothetical protein
MDTCGIVSTVLDIDQGVFLEEKVQYVGDEPRQRVTTPETRRETKDKERDERKHQTKYPSTPTAKPYIKKRDGKRRCRIGRSKKRDETASPASLISANIDLAT